MGFQAVRPLGFDGVGYAVMLLLGFGLSAGDRASGRAPQLNIASPTAWPRRTHRVQRSFLKIVVNLTRMAIEVLGDNLANLAEAGGGGNADVFTEVVKALEYPETHAGIKRLQLARLRQRFAAAGGRGPGLVVNLILCECDRGVRSQNQDEEAAANGPASGHTNGIPCDVNRRGTRPECSKS